MPALSAAGRSCPRHPSADDHSNAALHVLQLAGFRKCSFHLTSHGAPALRPAGKALTPRGRTLSAVPINPAAIRELQDLAPAITPQDVFSPGIQACLRCLDQRSEVVVVGCNDTNGAARWHLSASARVNFYKGPVPGANAQRSLCDGLHGDGEVCVPA